MKHYLFTDLNIFFKKNDFNVEFNTQLNDFFTGIQSLETASSTDLTFFNNSKYENLLSKTRAKGCFINDFYKDKLPSNCIPIIVKDPYLAFALTTNFLCPKINSNGIISKTANLNKDISLGKNIQIGHNVVFNQNCVIFDDCIIQHNSIIGPNVVIKKGSLIMSNCVISHAEIGNNCVIQSGSVIGGKGFGFTPSQKIEIKHLGKVFIGNNVDIGSNTTIDRAALESTIIQNNVRIDNLVQVAHGVEIGKNTIIAAQCGIAGSTKIGENCIIGGQVGLAGHLKIGNNVKIAAKSGVTKNISDNSVIAGFPALDIKIWKKNIINQMKKTR